MNIFLEILLKYVVGAQKNCLMETVLLVPTTYVLLRIKKTNCFKITHSYLKAGHRPAGKSRLLRACKRKLIAK